MKRALVVLLALSAACTGTYSSPAGPFDSSSNTGGAGGPGGNGGVGGVGGNGGNGGGGDGGGVDLGEARPPLCTADARDRKGPRLLRRLTKDEFEVSIRAAFGFDSASYPGSDLPPNATAQNGMTNQADLLLVDDNVADRLLSSAERVADLVVSDAHFTRILPCAAEASESCANTFLDTVGKRLFRRPLTSEERARYLALRNTVTEGGGDFRDYIRWVTVALVSSPNTVYRSEVGKPAGDGSYVLDGYERATALAFAFTGAPPDDALLAAAERGELDTQAGMENAARNLVFDTSGAIRPAFVEQFRRFTSQWLGLSALENREKDTTVFVDWNADVRASMRAEIDYFIEHVVFTEKGGIAELLTAPYTLLNSTLSAFYGYGSATSSAFELTQRPEGWGVGLLSQGALLALRSTNRNTSPTQRGHLVRTRIMCDDVPPPPPTAGILPEPTGAETTRQRYEDLHASNEGCASCHRAMDPIGFTFEHLDAVGRYRAQENGFDIDDTGSVVAMRTGEETVAVEGPVELASELAEREAVGACFGAFFASFSFGFDHHDTGCLVSTPREKLARGEMSLLDFMVAIATAPHFTARVD